jgi:hypothetical protein
MRDRLVCGGFVAGLAVVSWAIAILLAWMLSRVAVWLVGVDPLLP